MPFNNEIYSEVAKLYEAARQRSEASFGKALAKVRNDAPEAVEITDKISALGMATVSKVLSGTDTEQAVAEMRAEMESLLAKRGEILASAGLESDVFDQKYECGFCKDTGVTLDGICACRAEKIQQVLHKMSNVRMSGAHTFDDFDLSLFSKEIYPDLGVSPRENMTDTFLKAKEYAADLPGIGNSLLFYGDNGLGKTFVSDCIANEYLKRGKTVFYMSAPRMFTIFEEYKFGRNTSDEARRSIDAVFESQLLIIDDLGAEFKTQYVESILFEIVNSRLNENKKTIVSTNLRLKEFADKYTHRISSRILGMYEKIIFIGNDLRL